MKYMISVIIPVYNAEKYIDECLESVYKQKHSESFQIICVNDCSADKSFDILTDFSAKHENMEIIDLKTNVGPAEARNIGLKRAEGEFVYFLDADDCLFGDSLLIMYDIASHEELDILGFESKSLYEQKAPEFIFKTDSFRKQIYNKADSRANYLDMCKNCDYYCMPWLYFIKRSYLTSNDIQFYDCNGHEDVLFSYMLHVYGGNEKIVKDVFHLYRRHEGSITYDKNIEKHLVGYLKCYWHSMKFLLNDCKDEEQFQVTNKHIENLVNSILKWINLLTYDEYCKIQKRMDARYQVMLKSILANRYIFYLPEIITNQLMEAEEIYIYGAGKYAEIVKNELLKRNIKCSGYIVTKLDDLSANKSNVFEVDDIELKDTTIVIPGVSDKYIDSVCSKIKEKKWEICDVLKYRIE